MHRLFNIYPITQEMVRTIQSQDHPPHRHEFEELIIITQGSLEHFIDFRVEQVEAPTICYISQGKIHKLQPRPDLRGWVITYKNEFVPDSALNFYSHFMVGTSIPLPQNSCISRFVVLCELIHTEFTFPQADFSVIRHLLNALVSMIEAERVRNLPKEKTSKTTQAATFQAFLKILELNFRRPEGVRFYADKMNMTARNLNHICKNNFDKSVSEIIETRKMIEAKHLLMESPKTIAEIGFELGYNEKSYFSRAFKNHTGYTPTTFRELNRNMIS